MLAAGSILARMRNAQRSQPVLGGVTQVTSTRASSVSHVGSAEPAGAAVQVTAPSAPVLPKTCPENALAGAANLAPAGTAVAVAVLRVSR